MSGQVQLFWISIEFFLNFLITDTLLLEHILQG